VAAYPKPSFGKSRFESWDGHSGSTVSAARDVETGMDKGRPDRPDAVAAPANLSSIKEMS
jgi:hypothetical protein